MKKASTEHIVLITNLMDVSIDAGFGTVRTHTNALVLTDRSAGSDGPRYRMHGFYNECGHLTFDMVLPSFDWTIEPQEYKRRFMLCVAGASGKPPARIELLTDFANDETLDIERFDVTEDNRDWSGRLFRKVLRYYHAPYIVLGQQLNADEVRQALGVASVDELRKKEA